MENTEKTLSKQIAENLAYYVGNDKRCIYTNENNETACYYSGTSANKDTDGCFVGRLLSPEDRVKADEYFKQYGDDEFSEGSDVYSLVRQVDQGKLKIKIPNIIKENTALFSNLQGLHDGKYNWDEAFNISEIGKAELKSIIQKFDLYMVDFKDFL